MEEYRYFNKLDHTDLNMYQCGTQDCTSGHSFGPAVRDHYLIHYVLHGKGRFEVGGKTYLLEKGGGFLICPGIVTYYEADELEPWSYSWVGFHGLKAESYLKQANLTQANPTFRYDRDGFVEECINQMMAAHKPVKSSELHMMGYLYFFLSKLAEVAEENAFAGRNENRKEHYVKKAVELIAMNYSRNISISEISRYIGLDRSYFCSIFKDTMNMAPQEFLIHFRVNKACELMRSNILTIGDISRSVGYEDPLQFSKVFKKVKGLAPREYRKTG
jgi:AraC-like DNA-binding protein